MKGPIQSLPRECVVSRNDEVLPSVWIQGETVQPLTVDGAWLKSNAFPISATGPILVFSGENAADVQEDVLEQATSGTRVYMLVGPEWGLKRDSLETELLQSPGLLIRRVPEVPCTAIHSESSAQLRLGGGFVLQLDDEQAGCLRQTFLRLFWHEATEETWSGENGFSWRKASQRPFDIPRLRLAAAVRVEGEDAQLKTDEVDASMYLTAGEPPEKRVRRLWFPVGSGHQDRLLQLAKEGTEVVWDETGLSDLIVRDDGGEVLMPGKVGRLRVRLNGDQSAEIRNLLQSDTSWRFHKKIRLGDRLHRTAKFWLPGADMPKRLETEQLFEVSQLEASSLKSVPDTAPSSFPAAQPLALSVRYRWTVVPPRVPSGTEEDALVGRWRKLDKEWVTRLEALRDILDRAERERGRIAKTFSKLIGATLGFERTQKELLDRVAELQKEVPSKAEPSGATSLIRQLKELEEKAENHDVDLKKAERKAREDDERERQVLAWKERKDTEKHDLDERKNKLKTAENKRASLEQEIEIVAQSLKSADGMTQKDFNAKKLKLTDELKETRKQIKGLISEIESLEKQIEDPFVFRPPSANAERCLKSSKSFVPTRSNESADAHVPDESLPTVGSLLRRKSSGRNRPRYLVIENWEDLERGESDAKRLNANLVAPANI